MHSVTNSWSRQSKYHKELSGQTVKVVSSVPFVHFGKEKQRWVTLAQVCSPEKVRVLIHFEFRFLKGSLTQKQVSMTFLKRLIQVTCVCMCVCVSSSGVQLFQLKVSHRRDLSSHLLFTSLSPCGPIKAHCSSSQVKLSSFRRKVEVTKQTGKFSCLAAYFPNQSHCVVMIKVECSKLY